MNDSYIVLQYEPLEQVSPRNNSNHWFDFVIHMYQATETVDIVLISCNTLFNVSITCVCYASLCDVIKFVNHHVLTGPEMT